MDNLFSTPEFAGPSDDPELFEPVLSGPAGLLVERIVSHGHVTPEGEWYDQERDEWVVVLEGEARLQYADGSEIHLGRGEHLFLPKHCRHRVAYTSSPCVWLAVHGEELRPARQTHTLDGNA